MLFCPLLVAIGFAKNLLTFYIHAAAVYLFNKPPRTLFRIASTRNFYMGLLLVTVFMCALPVVYAMVELVPSTGCGPFRYKCVCVHVCSEFSLTYIGLVGN